MFKKLAVILSVLILAGGLFAESDIEVKTTTPVQSGWVEGSRPIQLDPSVGSERVMVGTYWRTTGDVSTIPGTHFLGTTDNQALQIKVNNQKVYEFLPHSTSPNIVGGYFGNFVTPGEYGGTISGGGSYGNVNSVLSDYGTIGGGRQNSASGLYSTIAGGRTNEAGGTYSVASGGYHNDVSGYASVIGGGYSSEVTGVYSFAGGGRDNTVSGSYATVGGGKSNTSSGLYSAVSGGYSNKASGYGSGVSGGTYGDATGSHAFLGGGYDNTSSGYAASVGGGYRNVADTNYSTVGGGLSNEASGEWSTIPGGYYNEASGTRSFAAGSQATAGHLGTFVWGDASGVAIASTGNNQFIARATGGVWFYTNSAHTAGAYLAAGSGSWSSVSDKNVKENFFAVDGAEILQKVAELPITTWNYKSQDDQIRHIGPMAQDFHRAFGVGDDDKHLTTVDVDGIALASIQALHKDNQEKDTKIAKLQAQLEVQQQYMETQQQDIETLEARLEAIEKELK